MHLAWPLCKSMKQSPIAPHCPCNERLTSRDRSWMTYFFKRKFNVQEGKLGSIFFVTSIISAVSTLVASSIAKRFGNVKVRYRQSPRTNHSHIRVLHADGTLSRPWYSHISPPLSPLPLSQSLTPSPGPWSSLSYGPALNPWMSLHAPRFSRPWSYLVSVPPSWAPSTWSRHQLKV